MSPQGRTWQVFEILVVLTNRFEQLAIGHQTELLGNHPGPRIRHRVVDGDLYFECADVPSAESLGDMQRLCRRVPHLVQPRLSVEAFGGQHGRSFGLRRPQAIGSLQEHLSVLGAGAVEEQRRGSQGIRAVAQEGRET